MLKFVLGAPDPEMFAISQLLKKHRVAHSYAIINGARVTSGNAYQCEPELGAAVYIECAPVGGVSNIDHHRVGDPGYDATPSDFFHGSSLGQTYIFLAQNGFNPGRGESIGAMGACPGALVGAELRIVGADGRSRAIPKFDLMTAACDHNLGAAYAGACPGIMPDAVLQHRAKIIAAFKNLDPSAVAESVKTSAAQIKKLYELNLCTNYIDLRDRQYDHLPDAACYARVGVQYTRDNKIGLLNVPSDCVKSWIWTINRDSRYANVYGVPARGYAGATIL